MTQISKQRPERKAPANIHPARTPKAALACCRPIDHLLNTELFRALADPTRVLLLACLAKCGRACSVGEVAQCCAVDFSVVSRHLALLARCGVLSAKKTGRVVHYEMRYRETAMTLRKLADAIEQCHPGGKDGCCGAC